MAMRPRDELELLNSRIAVIFGAVLIAFVILGFGFWRHQIPESSYYTQRAERNRIRQVPLAAPRGRILDREGRVFADSRPSYNLILSREEGERAPEETIRMLLGGIDTSEAALLERFEEQKGDAAYLPIVLDEDLSHAEVAYFQARSRELPEVSVEFRPLRRYEGGELGSHVLGYVSEITQSQLENNDFPDRKAGDIVGTSGLERQYDNYLQGRDGFRQVVVDTLNREIEVLIEIPPDPGQDLVTTLDLDLQMAARTALGEQTGVAVALDPRTGEVLALSSRPGFDPTLFAEGIAAEDWHALTDDPRKPLQNRAIQNRFSPGSVFKIFMAAAALEEGVVPLDETIMCPGFTTLYGNRFDCWSDGHGHVGIHDALVYSCNVFFYHLGDRLGIDRIARYAHTMGLGRVTGIDLPGENPGLMPSDEWKREAFGERWYPGETISVSIGQGAVSVTPLQLTWAVGGIAMGGRLARPHLVGHQDRDGIGEVPEPESYPLQPRVVAAVRDALWDVVNGGGTGGRARVAGFDVAGKTGTAQVVGQAAYGTRDEFEDHAWFVGFAPYDDPEIVVGAFVEHGGGGGRAAAPVAQAIFQTYFDKRTGVLTEKESATDLAGLLD